MIFNSILEKVKKFENFFLEREKEKIIDKLIKKETTSSSGNWYVIHCVALGVTLGNLVNNFFFSGEVGFWSTTFSLVYVLLGTSYVSAYLSRNKTKKIIIDKINEINTVRNFKGYMSDLSSEYLFSCLLFNNEEKNFEEIDKKLSKINNKEMKSLLNSLTPEEIEKVKELLKEYIEGDGFSSEVIYSLTIKCEKEIEQTEKEQNLLNILNNEEEKDLLDLMLEECNIERKEKINFKEVL